MKLVVSDFFHASHTLPDSSNLISKDCARLHGHTYLVKVEIESGELKNGMIADFKKIKDIIGIFDHRHVNDVFNEHGWNEPTTAENIAIFIKKKIAADFNFKTVSVSVCEGYMGEVLSSWIIV
ncbi:MAG TPA: 6-carboxytetrahydropterin synthase [Candidatus Bipolaricaulota bacterium]|nr:6-carboxytetrahydropterin synthase [Candidatus Bipolaricaulota bacterium]